MYGEFLKDYEFTSDSLAPIYLFGLETAKIYKENLDDIQSSL